MFYGIDIERFEIGSERKSVKVRKRRGKGGVYFKDMSYFNSDLVLLFCLTCHNVLCMYSATIRFECVLRHCVYP